MRSRWLLRLDIPAAPRPSGVRSTSVRPLTASTTPVISVQRRSSRARCGIGKEVGATSAVAGFDGVDAGPVAATAGGVVGAVMMAGYGPTPGGVGVTAGAGAVAVGAGAAVFGGGVDPFGVGADVVGAGVGDAGAAVVFVAAGARVPGTTPTCVGAPGAFAAGAAIAAAPPFVAAPPFAGAAGDAVIGAGAPGGVGAATLRRVSAGAPGRVGAARLRGVAPGGAGAAAGGADLAFCRLASADAAESPTPTPSAVISCTVRPSRPSTAMRAPLVSAPSCRTAAIVT